MPEQKLPGVWQGCRIEAETLILDNGESYTIDELRHLRWEKIQWERLARVLQRELSKSGMEGSIVFADGEWQLIRQALRLLDAKIPGCKIQAVA